MTRLTLIILSSCLCILGCGRTTPATPTDTKPFEAAIAEYCQSKGYGMKVVAVDSLNVNGNAAMAVCKMTEAEGTYAFTVKWEFTFHRDGDGWQVETHKAL